MKKILLLASIVASMAFATQAETILNESFNYAVGALYGNGKWVKYGAKTSVPIQVTDTALTFADYQNAAAGKAVALKAEVDNNAWQADGMDLQHIRVIAVDSKGRRVSNAVADVTVTVEGDATLAAMSNGNINSDELSVTDHQKLFNGSCLAILRAGTTPSPVMVTITAPGLKKAKLKLETK